MVCQFVIIGQNADFSVRFGLLCHFFSKFFLKHNTSKYGNMEKYINFVYSVSVPTKQRTYGVHI